MAPARNPAKLFNVQLPTVAPQLVEAENVLKVEPLKVLRNIPEALATIFAEFADNASVASTLAVAKSTFRVAEVSAPVCKGLPKVEKIVAGVAPKRV